MNEDKRYDNNPFNSENQNANNEQQDRAAESAEQKSSYYYSYGPFKSVPTDDNNEPIGASNQAHSSQEDIEITPPEPIKAAPSRSYYAAGNNELKPGNFDFANYNQNGNGNVNGIGNGNWNYTTPPRARSTFRTAFLSFMAGVVVIGSLMFASDYYNLFTKDTATASSSSTAKAVTASASLNTASLERPGDITSIVKQTSPAVVKIEIYQKQSKISSSQSSIMQDPFFQQFFGNRSGYGQQQQQQQGQNDQLVETSLGSGFIFDKDGYILTNQHVVQGADEIKVVLEGTDKTYTAKLLGSSFDLDLAVLKIEGSNFPTINIGDSDSAQAGDWLVAIGNPDGFDHTVTAGVLSAKGRTISIQDEDTGKTRNYKDLIQTDASINPGNSGGPLLNMNGEVIGLNVAVSKDSQGIGFAIPAKTILSVLDNLKSNKEIPQTPVPFIGATLATMTSDIAQQLNMDMVEGSIVSQVMYKTPAYDADLRQYDIITGIGGTKYSSNEQLIAAIQKQKVGDEVTLNIVRNGKAMDLKVKIGDKNKYSATQSAQTQQ